jgi:hypothetical protein
VILVGKEVKKLWAVKVKYPASGKVETLLVTAPTRARAREMKSGYARVLDVMLWRGEVPGYNRVEKKRRKK